MLSEAKHLNFARCAHKIMKEKMSKIGYNMLFRDFYLETASEGLVTAKRASEGYFKAKVLPQTSIYREIFPQKIIT